MFQVINNYQDYELKVVILLMGLKLRFDDLSVEIISIYPSCAVSETSSPSYVSGSLIKWNISVGTSANFALRLSKLILFL